jgi:integrase
MIKMYFKMVYSRVVAKKLQPKNSSSAAHLNLRLNSMSITSAPHPIFDSRDHIEETYIKPSLIFNEKDHRASIDFLQSYNGSSATFNAYRREVERLIQWTWVVRQQSITELRRADIEEYLHFCQDPPLAWIGTKVVTRFINKDGERIANPNWRPFVATISKAEHRQGKEVDRKNYELSQTAVREIFAILSSYYNFLIQEEVTEVNPVAAIRQRSKFLRKKQGTPKIRRLSELQWGYVIENAEIMATENPTLHERTLFIMSCLYCMYLRISELASSERWTPKMGDFHRDHDGLWWFTTVGKGNKERQIAVSNKMLEALKRYRSYLSLPSVPTAGEKLPLIPKTRGKGAINDIRHLRHIVQTCFDQALERLKENGHSEDADNLLSATVHWLRHTGISDDVKLRPREHVRDDAGHSSSAITDKYIDIELRERHASAKDKPLRLDMDD